MDRQVWVEYISAMVNLYGIVPVEQVAKVISEQNAEQVTTEEIKEWIRDPYAGSLAKVALQKHFVYPYGSAFFVGEWIMEFDSFDEHWLAQQGKPYYVPAREELMKWSDPHYFEKPQEFFELLAFFEAAFPKKERALLEGIVEDLQMGAESPFSIEMLTRELNRFGLTFGPEQLQQVVGLVINLHNHTRIQVNRGHTPAELFELEKASLLPLQAKVGRNDPCLCGSGKKYKKCCGRATG